MGKLDYEGKVFIVTGGGSLLYISSGAGLYGSPTLAHYAAAKLGVIGIARVAASEGRERRQRAQLPSLRSALLGDPDRRDHRLRQAGHDAGGVPRRVRPGGRREDVDHDDVYL
jgi:hypothetical protein